MHYKAKGVVPEDHPLCLGGHGLSPRSDGHVMPFLANSDCIIALGYDPIEMRTGWRNPWDPGIVIEFAAAPNRHDMHHSRLFWTTGLVASLDALALGATPVDRALRSDAAVLRKQLKLAFSRNDDRWGPHVAIDTIQKAVPRDTVITADSGAHRILLSQQWETYRERGMLQSSALCTMGCALPLAIGYQLASSTTKVIAFMGDAGLEMVLGELATLLRPPASGHRLCICGCVVDTHRNEAEIKPTGERRRRLRRDRFRRRRTRARRIRRRGQQRRTPE
jgi:acetolactate synthase I/II/III large subunit